MPSPIASSRTAHSLTRAPACWRARSGGGQAPSCGVLLSALLHLAFARLRLLSGRALIVVGFCAVLVALVFAIDVWSFGHLILPGRGAAAVEARCSRPLASADCFPKSV